MGFLGVPSLRRGRMAPLRGLKKWATTAKMFALQAALLWCKNAGDQPGPTGGPPMKPPQEAAGDGIGGLGRALARTAMIGVLEGLLLAQPKASTPGPLNRWGRPVADAFAGTGRMHS